MMLLASLFVPTEEYDREAWLKEAKTLEDLFENVKPGDVICEKITQKGVEYLSLSKEDWEKQRQSLSKRDDFYIRKMPKREVIAWVKRLDYLSRNLTPPKSKL